MFRLWGKMWKGNRMLKDTVICDSSGETRTHKVFNALSRPLWLDNNISEFKRLAKTRFRSDNFIDSIAFDYLEIQVLEED